MVLRLHMAAQLIERFVVLFFLQVRQLVHHDHPQKILRRIAKDGGDANFGFRLQLAALNAGDGGMQAERVVEHVDLVVVHHLIDRRRAAQIARLQILGVLVQRFIVVDIVTLRIALFQHLAETVLFD